MGPVPDGPQLAHVPQDGHPVVALRPGQNLQGRRHGLGVGVVAVVQNHPPARQAENPHPASRRDVGRRAPGDLLPAEAQGLPHRHGDGGGVGHVLPRGGDAEGIAVPFRHHGAADALHAPVGDLGNFGLAVPGLAAAHGSEGLGHRVQQGVVPVQNGQAVLFQVGENLALGPQDALPASQELNVGVPDVGDDGDVRLHHLRQVLDFPEVVHARLNDRRLVLTGQPQEGQGGPHVVVVVLRGLPDLQLRPQDGGHHLLGGGLPHAAGDLNHRNLELVPVGGGQGLEG